MSNCIAYSSINHQRLSRRVGRRLRVARDVTIRIGSLSIALHIIRRQELRHYRIIIARVVVIQSAQGVGELAGVAFVGAQAAWV